MLYFSSILGYSVRAISCHSSWNLRWASGFYIHLVLLYILNILNIFNVNVLTLLILFGNINFLTYHRPSLKDHFGDKLFALMLLPFLTIVLLRCLAPPYFIDVLQYHLPMTLTYIKNQAFLPLDDYFFAQAITNFAAEIPNAVLVLFFGSDSWNLINFGFVIIILCQLWEFFKNHSHPKTTWTIAILLTLSCGTFFHSVVYGKTEILIICVMMDLLLRLKTQEQWDGRSKFIYFVAVGFLPFFKISMAPAALFFAGYAVWKDSRMLKDQLFKFEYVGLFLGMLLLLLKNWSTHGLLFFPLYFDAQQVPEAFAHGLKSWMGAPVHVNTQELLHGIEYFFWGRPGMGFNAQAWGFFTIMGLGFALWKKKWNIQLLAAVVFAHWLYWFLTYRFPHTTFRLCFPVYFVFFMLLFYSVMQDQSKSFCRLLLVFSCCWTAYFYNKEGQILPGLKYNLGLQSLAEYYGNMNIHIGVLAQNLPKEVLDSSSKCAVESELAGSVNFKQAYYVNLSKDFDRRDVDVDRFLELLKEKDIGHIISDHSNSGSFFDKNLRRAVAMGKIGVVKNYREAYLYRVLSDRQ